MTNEPAKRRHFTTSSFWKEFEKLPEDVKQLALKNYELLNNDALHPSLQFKKVGKLWSARVGARHRALATESRDGFLWIWIGLHNEYVRVIKNS